MRFTGPAAKLPEHPTLSNEEQAATIFEVAAKIGVPATFLAAIRIAEGGGPGREFGVLSESAPTFEEQARVCAFSVRNNQYRYVENMKGWPINPAGRLSEPFIAFMAKRWAPVGAANDPRLLNQNWVQNVSNAFNSSGVAP